MPTDNFKFSAPLSADILIIEDEPKMAELLQTYLTAAGYASRWISDGREALPQVHSRMPDLILLDIMLPGCDGWQICRQLREFSDVPILMLSARIGEEDRLQGLELGADDYICKTPFSPREIVARVKAMLRRRQRGTTAAPSAVHINDELNSASIDGVTLNLTPQEYRLLKALAAAPGRVFSRDQLLDKLHDDYRTVTDRAVDSHIKNLRRKLEPFFEDRNVIHAIYGVGYKFEIIETH
ncbi:response regulator [Collimonas pratensis]|uniref:Transcriptional regulatory, C terminal family protein n=1 Tax=Collimonas pratensis TaxID=279113 RepID=A0ABN4M756_9BURK|nr:response regulator [Collimonas pratensis]AMP13618.1 transcriptional regulatory, C terminal family protein [Collimonas pratensis]